MTLIRLNLLDALEYPIETIEIEVDAKRTYAPNDWIETPGGDRWVISGVSDQNGQLIFDCAWFDGPEGSPYQAAATQRLSGEERPGA